MFHRFETLMNRLSAGLALLGGLGLIFATAATVVSIVLKLLRRGADALFGPSVVGEMAPWLRPILGEEELVTYGVGLALFAALPWVMIRKGHIRIDLFEPWLGKHFNRLLDLLSDAVLAYLAWLILSRQWFLIFKKTRGSKEPALDLILSGNFESAGKLLRASEESQILGVPLWPTYMVAEFCVAAFLVVALFCVLRSGRGLVLGFKGAL